MNGPGERGPDHSLEEALTLLTRSDAGTLEPAGEIVLPDELRRRYKIEATLGSGAMGMVVRARDLELSRTVAIKFLLRVGDPGHLARFLAEGRSMSEIRHKNVLQVFDMDALDGHPYLVLECVEGGTLTERMERGAMPLGEAARIALDVLSGLEAVHAGGFMHRDLKPDNILFTTTGELRIADLGLAKRLEERHALTRKGALMGTPRYMAPEILKGHDATRAVDLYAIGQILYEMLSGRNAFPATSLGELLAQKMSPPVPLETYVTGLPAGVCACVAAALAEEPDERPASAAAFSAALRAALPKIRTERRSSSQVKRIAPVSAARAPAAPPRSRVPVVALLAASLVVVGAGLALRRPGPGGQAAANRSPSPTPSAVAVLGASPVLADAEEADTFAQRAQRIQAKDLVGLTRELLSTPYRLFHGLSRGKYPPGPQLVRTLDPAQRSAVHTDERAAAERWFSQRLGLDFGRVTAAAGRVCADRAAPMEARYAAYRALATFSNLDGAGELTAGQPVIDVPALTRGFIAMRRDAAVPAAGFEPLSLVKGAVLNGLIARSGLPVFVRHGSDINDANGIGLMGMTWYEELANQVKPLERPSANGDGIRWCELGAAPALTRPGGGCTVTIRVTELDPGCRLWLRFGGHHEVYLATGVQAMKSDFTSDVVPDRALLDKLATTLSVTLPPGFVDDDARGMEVGGDTIDLSPEGGDASSRFYWLLAFKITAD